MPSNNKIKNFFSSTGALIIKIIIFAAVIYIIFSISKSIWKNWQITQEIKKTDELVTELTEKIATLKNQILYFQTETFKELEARKRLGLKKAEENVLLIPENVDTVKSNNSTDNEVQNKTKESSSNPIKWWQYIIQK